MMMTKKEDMTMEFTTNHSKCKKITSELYIQKEETKKE
jgi:hypothetical protein